MPTYACPKGHESTEADFCSECGAKIQGVANLASPANTAAPATLTCPDCTTPHEADSGDFCEICGYNFITGSHGEVPIAVTHPPVLDPIKHESTKHEPSPALPTPPAAATSNTTWEVVITVDPALGHPDSPPAPNQAAIVLPLAQPVNLIGRSSQVRAIYPEIALDFDDAVSHRHALLTLQPDGTLTLRDIGSSNGTLLNGVELPPMTDVTLTAGSEFSLGHWTRIRVQRGDQPAAEP